MKKVGKIRESKALFFEGLCRVVAQAERNFAHK